MPEHLMHRPLFCFGTLMDTSVLALVSAQPLQELTVVPAMLRDHVQREVIGESFPVLVPEPGGTASGSLIHGLDETALERILFFEGDEYRLAPLTVIVDGTSLEASHFEDANTYRTGERSWDLASWQTVHRAEFLTRAKAYMQLFGTMSKAEADAHW